MKLIMRGDDLGFSEAVNHGLVKSAEDGVITSIGMMVNMPATMHGYELVKNQDIALGQHTNICVGKPLSDPKEIPTLVDANGDFCSSREIRGRKEDTIDIAQCEKEIEAQLKRFQEITGKLPDYFEGHAVFSGNFFKALENVARRHNLFYVNPFDPKWEEATGIHGLPMAKMDENNLYDPIAYFAENLPVVKGHGCSLMVFHPGYLDQYILRKSSFTLVRPMECEFLCSEKLRSIIEENHIKLTNFKNYRD